MALTLQKYIPPEKGGGLGILKKAIDIKYLGDYARA